MHYKLVEVGRSLEIVYLPFFYYSIIGPLYPFQSDVWTASLYDFNLFGFINV